MDIQYSHILMYISICGQSADSEIQGDKRSVKRGKYQVDIFYYIPYMSISMDYNFVRSGNGTICIKRCLKSLKQLFYL